MLAILKHHCYHSNGNDVIFVNNFQLLEDCSIQVVPFLSSNTKHLFKKLNLNHDFVIFQKLQGATLRTAKPINLNFNLQSFLTDFASDEVSVDDGKQFALVSLINIVLFRSISSSPIKTKKQSSFKSVQLKADCLTQQLSGFKIPVCIVCIMQQRHPLITHQLLWSSLYIY